MSENLGAPNVDPVVLHSLLQRHRVHLENTHREVTSLRAFIAKLEEENDSLRHEVNAIKLELGHYKEHTTELSLKCEEATSQVDRLAAALQKQNQDHAMAIAEMESQRKQMLVSHKLSLDRISAQLEATQQPFFENQPLPWKRISAVADHPVHVLREVVLEDQRREERILQRNLPILMGDNSFGNKDALSRLQFDANQDGSSLSHDTEIWRLVLKRLHVVLKERRLFLGITANDSSADFILRSRNSLVAEWVQVHKEIIRAIHVIMSVKKTFLSNPSSFCGGTLFIERQVDLALSILGDIDTQCHRVRQSTFSEIDIILYPID